MHSTRQERHDGGRRDADRRAADGSGFLGRIDAWLGALGSARVRVSFFAVGVPPARRADALRALEAALAASNLVGRLPGGMVGIFHCGPRPSADAAFEREMEGRIRAALSRTAAGGDLRVLAAHAWAHEVERAADLIALTYARAVPQTY